MKYLFLLQKLQGAARGETRARARGHTLWGTQVSIFIFIVHKLKSLESQQAMFSCFALPFIRPPPLTPLTPSSSLTNWAIFHTLPKETNTPGTSLEARTKIFVCGRKTSQNFAIITLQKSKWNHHLFMGGHDTVYEIIVCLWIGERIASDVSTRQLERSSNSCEKPTSSKKCLPVLSILL